MLKVQKVEPAKPMGKKLPAREIPRMEKKNKGFLEELLKVAAERSEKH